MKQTPGKSKTVKPKSNIKKIVAGVITGALGSVAAITGGVYAYGLIKQKSLTRRSLYSQRTLQDNANKISDFNEKINTMYDTAVKNYAIHKNKSQYDSDIMAIHKILQRGI